jgi:hypothetical protein
VIRERCCWVDASPALVRRTRLSSRRAYALHVMMHVAKCGDLVLRFNRHLEGFPQRCSDLTQPRRHRGIMQDHFAARSSPAECKSHSNTATCSRRGYHCSVLIHDARRHPGSRQLLGIANCLRSDAGENSHPEAQCSSLPVPITRCSTTVQLCSGSNVLQTQRATLRAQHSTASASSP